MEPVTNLGLMHKSHADERLKAFQEKLKNITISVGDYVKTGFIEGDETEHMWVSVTNADNPDYITGILDNDPILISNLNCGDKVTVNRSNISDYIPV